jgi:hypothetical protein
MTDPITPDPSLPSVGKPVVPGQTPEGFESYMQGSGKSAPPPPGAGTSGPTPLDLARGPAISSAGVSFDSIIAQATNAQDSLGTVSKQLQDKNLTLKRSQSHLIRQKLGDANSHIRAAGSKLGLDLPESEMPPGTSGITRFLAMVNDGQDQLVQVQEHLAQMAKNKQQLTPGEMLSVQVKMGLAQQEIEYTSTLLSKVIQSITQIINTQL